jgi:predicted aldo/keto reductase-like oxidoreductase
MPCPQGLDIPYLFKFFNQYQLSGKSMHDPIIYQGAKIVRADQCVDCGHCAPHCPQQLEIPELMKLVHRELT